MRPVVVMLCMVVMLAVCGCTTAETLEEIMSTMIDDMESRLPSLVEMVNAHRIAAESIAEADELVGITETKLQEKLNTAEQEGLDIRPIESKQRQLVKMEKVYDQVKKVNKAAQNLKKLLDLSEYSPCDKNKCTKKSSTCQNLEDGYGYQCICHSDYAGQHCQKVPSKLIAFDYSVDKLYQLRLSDNNVSTLPVPSSFNSASIRCRANATHYIAIRMNESPSQVLLIKADTGEVVSLPDIPGSTLFGSCIVVNGYLYLVGGHQRSVGLVKDVQRLSLNVPDQWERLADVEGGNPLSILVTNTTHLFTLGGHTSRDIHVYDLCTMNRTLGPRLEEQFWSPYHGAVLYNSTTILLFRESFVREFNIDTMTLGRSKNLPFHSGMNTVNAFLYNGEILLFCMYINPRHKMEVFLYDYTSNTIDSLGWSEQAPWDPDYAMLL